MSIEKLIARALQVSREEPLWIEYCWIAPDGLEHTEHYDFRTQEYSEEWHPKESDIER